MPSIKCVLCSMAKGLEPFYLSHLHSCTGAMLSAPLKSNGLPCPVQIPDTLRVILTRYSVSKLFKSKEALNFLENGAGRTDPQYSRRGLSRDGCTYVVNEIQLFLETAKALDPVPLPMQAAASHSPTMPLHPPMQS